LISEMNRTCQIVYLKKKKKNVWELYSKIFNRKHKRELIKIAIIDSRAILVKYLHLKRMKI